jgi:hypothetical protein
MVDENEKRQIRPKLGLEKEYKPWSYQTEPTDKIEDFTLDPEREQSSMSNTIDTEFEHDILTPEETARYLRKSTSWVYKHWQELGGRKLGGSLFFPRKEDLYEHLFSKGKGVEVRLHPGGNQAHQGLVQTKTDAQKAASQKKEEIKNPPPSIEVPIDMVFLDLVNLRLDHVKAYNSEEHYRSYLYLGRRWIKKWGEMMCSEITRQWSSNTLWNGEEFQPTRPTRICAISEPPSISASRKNTFPTIRPKDLNFFPWKRKSNMYRPSRTLTR